MIDYMTLYRQRILNNYLIIRGTFKAVRYMNLNVRTQLFSQSMNCHDITMH